MPGVIISSFWSLLVLFIWFDTNAFYEYTREFLRYNTYESKKHMYDDCSLSDFIAIHYSSFWSRLLSCPYCLGFWSSLAFTLAFSSFLYLPMIYFLTLVLYFSFKYFLELVTK
jgi:hypothetical protein